MLLTCLHIHTLPCLHHVKTALFFGRWKVVKYPPFSPFLYWLAMIKQATILWDTCAEAQLAQNERQSLANRQQIIEAYCDSMWNESCQQPGKWAGSRFSSSPRFKVTVTPAGTLIEVDERPWATGPGWAMPRFLQKQRLLFMPLVLG